MKQLALDSKQTTLCLNCGIRFFLAAALTGSQIFGGFAPFALGFVAAAGAGALGFSALLGALVGAFLFMDFSIGLSFLATAVLISSAVYAFSETKIFQKPAVPPIVAAALFFAVQLIYLLQAARPLELLFPCLASCLLVAFCSHLYAMIFDSKTTQDRQLALLFLALSLLIGFADLLLPGGISFGRALACTLVLLIAFGQGASVGAASGICVGLAMDLCADGGALFFSALYGFGGLLAGLHTGRRRLSCAGLFLLASLLLLLPGTAEAGMPLLGESLCGAVLFLLLPARLFGGKRIAVPVHESNSSVLEDFRRRLTLSAAAFRDLYDSCGEKKSNVENPAIVFDRSAETVCRSCALCDICWKREYTTTFNALNDATPFLLERGRALAKDFPQHFADRCIHLPELLSAINGELSAFLLRQQFRHQLDETRRSARGQYAQLSDLLTSTAAHLGGVQTAIAVPPPYRVGAALRPKANETISGDCVTSFENDEGMLYLLLSDGMGSGEAARRESSMAVRLMERFLKAGIDAEPALRTLNSALVLRSAETGSFTTIDLLALRPATGEATLYKYGAAPSYLKRAGRVRRITGSSLPAGLHSDPAPPDMTHFSLEADSFVILISDGITDARHDEWLQNLLAGWSGDDPQLLVALILAESKKHDGALDDCGVLVLYFEKNSLTEI